MPLGDFLNLFISDVIHEIWSSESDCSKFMTSLVNISLKFQTLISEIYANIFVEKI